MKVAFCMDLVITCGGVKIPFGYCRELQKLGIDSKIYANGRNKELEDYYGVEVKRLSDLSDFTDEDVIIAVWWRQIPELEKYKGRKIQFLQGKDIAGNIGDDHKKECLETRSSDWEVLAVSDYAGSWVGKPYTVIPNAVDDIFFKDYGLERDIDALIEGNDEPLKNIKHSIALAKSDGHKKIVWFARQTHPLDGIINITSPKQEDIPKLYQRAKHFYKHSTSEGFCLPLVEAMASGCEIHSWDMGGNNFPWTKEQSLEFNWETSTKKIIKFLYEKNNS
jgi:glycosyltransferase involved in cell wall biosynthesis